MLKGIRVLLFLVVPALCTVYVIYFLALGGLHRDMRDYDIQYISEHCPALSRQVGPLEIEKAH
ncbi:hypothetical protein QW131_15310 [Roseibium salinum]|nr:hypothetical protein [Roseibium salinum]